MQVRKQQLELDMKGVQYSTFRTFLSMGFASVGLTVSVKLVDTEG